MQRAQRELIISIHHENQRKKGLIWRWILVWELALEWENECALNIGCSINSIIERKLLKSLIICGTKIGIIKGHIKHNLKILPL